MVGAFFENFKQIAGSGKIIYYNILQFSIIKLQKQRILYAVFFMLENKE